MNTIEREMQVYMETTQRLHSAISDFNQILPMGVSPLLNAITAFDYFYSNRIFDVVRDIVNGETELAKTVNFMSDTPVDFRYKGLPPFIVVPFMHPPIPQFYTAFKDQQVNIFCNDTDEDKKIKEELDQLHQRRIIHSWLMAMQCIGSEAQFKEFVRHRGFLNFSYDQYVTIGENERHLFETEIEVNYELASEVEFKQKCIGNITYVPDETKLPITLNIPISTLYRFMKADVPEIPKINFDRFSKWAKSQYTLKSEQDIYRGCLGSIEYKINNEYNDTLTITIFVNNDYYDSSRGEYTYKGLKRLMGSKQMAIVYDHSRFGVHHETDDLSYSLRYKSLPIIAIVDQLLTEIENREGQTNESH